MDGKHEGDKNAFGIWVGKLFERRFFVKTDV
jgi:hypothetical protein